MNDSPVGCQSCPDRRASSEEKKSLRQGFGDEIPNVPMREAPSSGIGGGPKPAAPSGRNRQAKRRESQGALARLCEFPGRQWATITILIYSDRIFTLIPTGYALRWAQKDEGGYSDPPYIPLDSHYPSETLGRYKNRYSSQAPFPAHAGEQVATVLWRSGEWSEGSKSF